MFFGVLLTGASSAAGVSNRLPGLLALRRLGDGLTGSFKSVRNVKELLLGSVRDTLHGPVVEREGRGGVNLCLPYSGMSHVLRFFINRPSLSSNVPFLHDSNYRIR